MGFESLGQSRRQIQWNRVIQYLLAVLLAMNAIGLTVHSIPSGGLMFLAAGLALPQVRKYIESVSPIVFSPVVIAGTFATLIVLAGVVLLPVVDLSQVPDYLVPFQ